MKGNKGRVKKKKSGSWTANMLDLEQKVLAVNGQSHDAHHILMKHNMGWYNTKKST